ncbi:hypothetical protein C8R41DRAFT_832729, partial [Lentinula lateritia]
MIRKAFLRAFCVFMDGARSENWHVPTCPEFPECHASQYPNTSDISMFGSQYQRHSSVSMSRYQRRLDVSMSQHR